MNAILQLVESNVGMSIENILLFIVVVAGLMIYAKSFQIGLTTQMVGSGGLFMMWYYLNSVSTTDQYNFIPSLVVFFISLALMALSLYFTSKAESSGVIS